VPDPHSPALTFRQVARVLVGLLLATFTAMLSTTIVANALPEIISDLHGTQSQYSWVITTALLANAASTPLWGKLADLFNKKLLVQIAITIFTVASVTAGFATSTGWLIASRALQGIGMGGLMSLSMAVIATITPPSERGRYSGLVGAVIAVAQSSGPIVGGLIVDSPLGWRWTFFVCVPLAVISLVMLQLTLHVPTIRRDEVHVDWLGATLLTGGVSTLLIWVSLAGPNGDFAWGSPTSVLLAAGGTVLLALTLLVERHVPEPILPLRILRRRTVAMAVLASIPVGVAMFGTSTYLGEYFQVSLGQTPTAAGLLQLPMIIAIMIASTVSGSVISRTGRWKRWLIAGALLLTTGLAALALTTHETPLWETGVRIAIMGLGSGMLMQNLVLVVQNQVSVRDVGAAGSLVAFIRTFAGASGVAVLGTVLSGRVSGLVRDGLAATGAPTGDVPSGTSLDLAGLPEGVRTLVMAAYGDATGRIFLIAAVLSLGTVVAVTLLPNLPLRTTLDLQPTGGDEPPSRSVER
jgi:EmrB/QacA subfamily drug resistance transporter